MRESSHWYLIHYESKGRKWEYSQSMTIYDGNILNRSIAPFSMIKENNLPLLSYIDARKSSALYKWYDRFESKDRILEFSQSITTVIKNILEELSKTNIRALLIDINTRNILVWNNIRCFKPVIEDISLGELSKENILAILLLLTQRIVSCDMD